MLFKYVKIIAPSLYSFFQRHIDFIYTIAGNIFPTFAGLLFLPYLFIELGSELFGILNLLWAVVSYLSIFDFGLGKSITLEVSRCNEQESISNTVVSKILFKGIFIATAVSLLTLLFIFSLFFSDLLSFKSGILITLLNHRASILILLASLPFAVISSVIRGVLEGLHKFKISSINRSFFGFLIIFGPATVAFLGLRDPIYLSISLLVARILSLIQLTISFDVSISIYRISFRDIIDTLRFGGWVFLSSLIGPIMVYGDKFLIAYLLGATPLGIYSLVQDLLLKILVIPTAISTVLFPRLSSANLWNIKSIYYKAKKKLSILMIPISVSVVLFLPYGLSFFINSISSTALTIITAILSFGILFNSLAQLPLIGLYGIGKPSTVAFLHSIELPFYLALVFLLTTWFGLFGAAASWSIRVVIDFVCLEFFLTRIFSSNYDLSRLNAINH